jgi:hypothetical protein
LKELSARRSLLDKQIVDKDERLVGRVDDLELELPDDGGPPFVAHILTGAQALGERLGGVTGGAMAATARRLRLPGAQGPVRLDPALVDEVEPALRLRVPLGELPHVMALERWLARNVVEGIPGAGRADE